MTAILDGSEREDHWNALYHVLKEARPHGLEVECLDNYIQDITSPHFDGNYARAANDALYDWDI